MKYLVSLFIMAVLFTGCAEKTVPVKVVYKTKLVKVKPDSELVDFGSTPKPPSKKEFMNTKKMGRETLLTNYIVKLLYFIKKEKSRNQNLKKFLNSK